MLSGPVLKHGPNTASRETGVNARQTTLKQTNVFLLRKTGAMASDPKPKRESSCCCATRTLFRLPSKEVARRVPEKCPGYPLTTHDLILPDASRAVPAQELAALSMGE